jgi:hypothetical protein
MNCVMTLLVEDPIPTRYTLLSRLEDRGDQDSWKDFFDTYWRLIYSVAVKSGLTEAEAQDVVQETIISVARDIHKFKRDPGLGHCRPVAKTHPRQLGGRSQNRSGPAAAGRGGNSRPGRRRRGIRLGRGMAGKSAESSDGNNQTPRQGRTLSNI